MRIGASGLLSLTPPDDLARQFQKDQLVNKYMKRIRFIRDECYPKMPNCPFVMFVNPLESASNSFIHSLPGLVFSRQLYENNLQGINRPCAPFFPVEWKQTDVESIRKYLYVTEAEKRKKQKTRDKTGKKPEKERFLICKQCENKISKPEYRISVQGAIDHTFLNPAGQVFNIGCFQRADGCVVLGDPSAEWTWFQGFLWQVAICGQCLKHLGWFFNSEEETSFFGLILDALV